ncbi:hypothetical protein [Dactylosporangium sp. NPDC050588]|uniref:hypothetical protein n=1 Tax=Dactylosporangium sp. NPDC050588 TaxID=3157211 RepID=UPI0034094CA6
MAREAGMGYGRARTAAEAAPTSAAKVCARCMAGLVGSLSHDSTGRTVRPAWRTETALNRSTIRRAAITALVLTCAGLGMSAPPANAFAIYVVTNVNDTGAGSLRDAEHPADRNLISGNRLYGVELQGTGTKVLGNRIGSDATGTTALGNGGGGIKGQPYRHGDRCRRNAGAAAQHRQRHHGQRRPDDHRR